MRVCIDEPWQYELANAVDLPGISMFADQIVIARGDDTSVLIEDQNTELLNIATRGRRVTGYRVQDGIGVDRCTESDGNQKECSNN